MKEVKFNASQCGALMVTPKSYFSESNAKELARLVEKGKTDALTPKQQTELARLVGLVKEGKATENQIKEVNRLELKQQAGPLTSRERGRLEELKERQKAPFEFSETAKTYIEDRWLLKEYDYKEPVFTYEIMKGHMCEQDSIKLVSEVQPLELFRTKNKEQLQNDWFTGHPDVRLKPIDLTEDVKTSWTLKTHFKVKQLNPYYYCQGQVYMCLDEVSQFKVHYCLVDTPEEIVQELLKKFFFKFGADEENPHYQEACMRIRINHTMMDRVPKDKRVKTFAFERDETYLAELKRRVQFAREYYASIEL